MVTAQELLATKVGVAPGTTTFTLGADCDSGPRGAIQRQRFLPTLARLVGDAAAAAAMAVAPTLAPGPTQPNTMPSPTPAPAQPTQPMRAYSPYATFEKLDGKASMSLHGPVLGGLGGFLRRLFSRKSLGYILSPAGDISPRMYGEVTAVM